jgi:MPBQ/MSBQ methyltransferase
MPESDLLKSRITERYDASMYDVLTEEYNDYSGFHNFGFWTSTTRNQREACENLIDILLEEIPSKKGPILDAACGMGASTERLTRYLPPSDLTGINISEKQLLTCRDRVPGAQFFLMDATQLDFPDNSFENILCVEAAFHFDTRQQFVNEAYRVLNPGGCLALSDVIVSSRQAAEAWTRFSPLVNYHPTVDDYRRSFEQCGFTPVRIAEVRSVCWEGYRDNMSAFLRRKAQAGAVPWAVARQVIGILRFTDWLLANYMLVWAIKPDVQSNQE